MVGFVYTRVQAQSWLGNLVGFLDQT